MSRIAATTSSAAVKPSWAAKRAARIIRSGSSLNDCCGVPGVRSSRRARSSRPPNGSTRRRVAMSTASALTVKSRRDRSPSRVSPNCDRRLAGRGVVGVGPVGGDLDGQLALAGADGAVGAADVPHRVGPVAEQPLGLVRVGRGGEVPVHAGPAEPAEQRVADGSADDREGRARRPRTPRRAARRRAPRAAARRPRGPASPTAGRPEEPGARRARTRESTVVARGRRAAAVRPPSSMARMNTRPRRRA